VLAVENQYSSNRSRSGIVIHTGRQFQRNGNKNERKKIADACECTGTSEQARHAKSSSNHNLYAFKLSSPTPFPYFIQLLAQVEADGLPPLADIVKVFTWYKQVATL